MDLDSSQSPPMFKLYAHLHVLVIITSNEQMYFPKSLLFLHGIVLPISVSLQNGVQCRRLIVVAFLYFIIVQWYEMHHAEKIK